MFPLLKTCGLSWLPSSAGQICIFFLCTKEILSENPFLLLGLLISVIIWSQIGNCWSWMFDICFKFIDIYEKLFVFSWFPVQDDFRSFFFSFFGWCLLYLSLEHFNTCSALVILLKSSTVLQGSLYCSGHLIRYSQNRRIWHLGPYARCQISFNANKLQLHKISNWILADIYSSFS